MIQQKVRTAAGQAAAGQFPCEQRAYRLDPVRVFILRPGGNTSFRKGPELRVKSRRQRKLSHAPEGPFVKRHVPAAQQVGQRDGFPQEFPQRQPGGGGISPAQAAAVVVLPALSHDAQPGRDLFQPHVPGIVGQQRLPQAGERPGSIGKHCAADGGGQIFLRNAEPLCGGLRRLIGAEEHTVKVRDGEHSHPLPGIKAFPPGGNPKEAARQGIVSRLYGRSRCAEVLRCQPQAEARAVIMVGGQFIVVAEALRPEARKARRDPGRIFRELFSQHGRAVSLIVPPG